MAFGAALGASFRAALLVGPALGILSGLVLLALIIFSDGFDGEFAISAAVMLGFVGIVGLFNGGPVCWLGSAMMLKAASANRRWAGHGPWIAAGVGFGSFVGGALGLLSGGIEGVVGLAVIVGLLGGMGGWLCRHILRRTVRELDVIDPNVFA